MLNLFRWFFAKDLKSHLYLTKKVVVKGIRFEIKKVDVTNYLDGSSVGLAVHTTHIEARMNDKAQPPPEDKAKKHLKDVVIAGVVEPPILRVKNTDMPDAVLIDDLCIDWEMVQSLYNEIMYLTYGKKKVEQERTRLTALQS